MNKEFNLCSILDCYIFDIANSKFIKIKGSTKPPFIVSKETIVELPPRGLSEIAEEINQQAINYRMAKFQALRKELKGLSKVTTTKIFTNKTTTEEWAFHHGGRKELQFNIGFETVGNERVFRHGVAFSLEPSQTLPDIEVLLPKVERFNDYVRETSTDFYDMRMWEWYNNKCCQPHAIREISPDLMKPGYFIFIGKRTGFENIDIASVLIDFDRLLNMYEYVEGSSKIIRTIPQELDTGFLFRHGNNLKKSFATGNRAERRLDIVLRHNDLVTDVHEYLQSLYGDKNVGTEIYVNNGRKIDIVVLDGNAYTFYEIKTSSCLQSCIREALSQLLEYSLWPDTERAKKLIIVTENDATKDAKRYLAKLRICFGLPIYHQKFDSQLKALEEMW